MTVTQRKVTYGATESKTVDVREDDDRLKRKQTAVQTMKSFWNKRQDFAKGLSERTRQACYTRTGYCIQLTSALFMCILQLYLIFYEFIYLNPFSEHPEMTPDWFVCTDLFIICYLLVECTIHFVEYEFSWSLYIRSKENQFDIVVFIASLIVAILYIWEIPEERNAADVKSRQSMETDNLTFLALRVVRDIVRMFRVIFFINLLKNTVIKYDNKGRVAEITLEESNVKENGGGDSVWLLEGGDVSDSDDIEENFIGA